ncbi:hypothetical protein WJX77_011451 [Trebouxia sp. C0004]
MQKEEEEQKLVTLSRTAFNPGASTQLLHRYLFCYDPQYLPQALVHGINVYHYSHTVPSYCSVHSSSQ